MLVEVVFGREKQGSWRDRGHKGVGSEGGKGKAKQLGGNLGPNIQNSNNNTK